MIKEEYPYEEILVLENINDFDPDQVCNLLALIFETGRENKDVSAIKNGLRLATSRNLDDFSEYQRVVYHFFVANGWSYLHQLTHVINSNEFWEFETPEVENEIINLRKAISFSDKVSNRVLVSQILTNLGNTFDQIGRFVEAIHYWDRAMKINPGFGMAIGNLGFGLGHYARVLFDEGHRFLFCQYAYKYLIKASVSEDVYSEGKQGFLDLAKTIEERYGKENLNLQQDLKNFSLGSSFQERDYRQWCIDNALFLNPLNDFIYENIVGHDCLFLPTITLKRDEPSFFHSLYNQIKQEFASARYLYYQSLTDQKPHFSDKHNMQMDTLDYAVYSLNIEKLKISFRICYSLFDKIGYMINSYFEIGMNPMDVSFRKIWFKKLGNEINKWELNPLISETQNWPLRGLYWLSKDLFEKGSEFSKSILPEAQQIATIRNFIEHKSFKIVDMRDTAIVDDGLTYQIQRHELEQKVMTLMKMARSGILNLSFAIHLEEIKKNKAPAMPVSFFKLEDKYKT
jgi:tetratricopeptide (TPR) repeat protein